MYTFLPAAGKEGTQLPTDLTFNVRASWIAGAPVHGNALLALCRPSQVFILLFMWSCYNSYVSIAHMLPFAANAVTARPSCATTYLESLALVVQAFCACAFPKIYWIE